MNNTFLTQVAQFIKLAIDNNEELQDQVYLQKKEAAIKDLDKEKYRVALMKAADILYDTDFLGSEVEKRTFVKKAMEDQVYVVRTLEKLAEASDVSQIGRPASVAARPKSAEYDPVMDAAFGRNNNNIIDD